MIETRRPARALAIGALAVAAAAGLASSPVAAGVAQAQPFPACVISSTNVVLHHVDALASQNRCWATDRARLIFQSDGNLVVYNAAQRPVFASNTVHTGYHLILQGDGNLVIYTSRARPVFATDTAGHPGAYLAVQTDGNVVLYSAGGRPLWATNTVAPGAMPCDVRDGNAVVRSLHVTSSDGYCVGTRAAELRFQADGNLVLYRDSTGTVCWAAGTAGRGRFLDLQSDGNLVVYQSDHRTVAFASGTSGHPGAYLAVQTDGAFVIYGSAGQPLFVRRC